MSEWIDCQNDEIEVAEKDLESKLLKTIQEELNSSNKSSALDNKQKQQISAKVSTQQHNRHTDTKNLIDVTRWMDGWFHHFESFAR